MTLSGFRSSLYRLARIIGDVQAIRRGPRAVMTRLGRKFALRKTGTWINHIK